MRFGRSEVHEAQSSKSSLNVITISEDEPESALYDDAPDDFSVSEQPQLKDKPFKLDCSAIIDNSTKIYKDSRKIEVSRLTNKKRVLPTSSKNKCQ
ncbi:hypothetical protein GLOIN_2v1783814 [Rhizophagus irregularis DAOM 181602=DAOM 197198]|nr:hypothetical protein GLOIN_2v1783814 [Rhizophagus irregularis DAOM 181602=DAOM 197198]